MLQPKNIVLFTVISIFLAIPIIKFSYDSLLSSRPNSINKTANIAPTQKPTSNVVHPKTNSWFSSLYQFPSENVYALPASFKFTKTAIELGAPQESATAKTVYATHIPICNIKRAQGQEFQSTNVESYGDWDVKLALTGEKTTKLHLIQGSVAQYITPGEDLTLSCKDLALSQDESDLIIKASSATILVSAQTEPIAIESNAAKLTANINYRIMIFPPDFEIAQIDRSYYTINSTNTAYDIGEDTINTTLTLDSSSKTPYITIWPHQWSVLTTKPDVLGTYKSGRGTFRLVATNEIKTEIPISELPSTFTAIGKTSAVYQELQDKITADNAEYLKSQVPSGVYFKGTWLGAVTSLLQLNALYDRTADSEKISQLLITELQKGLSTLQFDQGKNMVIAQNDEFGNKTGNDHHFHYGYYIRAAAVLKQLGYTLTDEDTAKIDLLIEDIASEKGNKFPRLRAFNTYHGHSYASGDAKFADGNNQESTSEALNAWYALTLWGKESNNQELIDRGQWLFSQELQATNNYWFFEQENKPEKFDHQMFSIVWDGKRDFATWFSANPMHIYGIQFLPLTPASIYLKTIPNREAHIKELETLLGNEAVIKHEWADLYLTYLATTDEQKAKQILPRIETHAGAKLRSLPIQLMNGDFVE